MAIAVVNSASSTSGALGFTATAGRIVLATVSVRNWNVTWNSGGGWSLLAKWDNNTNSNEPPCFLFGKVAAGGETTVGGSYNNDAGRAGCAIEITGATLTGVSGTQGQRGNSATATLLSVTPTPGASCIVVGGSVATFPVSSNPGNGFTTVGSVAQGGSQWPFILLAYRIVPVASGGYSMTNTWTNGGAWWSTAGGVAVYEAAPLFVPRNQGVLVG